MTSSGRRTRSARPSTAAGRCSGSKSASAPRPRRTSRTRASRLPADHGDLSGFAFTELNAPPETVQGLERLLAGLGLRRTGQHRTKPVELWEAGNARILLNSGRRSPPAAGRFAVAAVGLDVTDAASIARRATALRAPIVPRHRNWDEADLIGIESPDGVEIFLCEQGSDWRGDFDPCTDDHPFSAKTRLTGIDHVALAQPLTLFHESVLFYRSLLGLVPLETQELASPNGLIRSQALTSADGRGDRELRDQRACSRRRAHRVPPGTARGDPDG